MSEAPTPNHFPRGVLLGAAVLIAVSLALAAYGRFVGGRTEASMIGQAVASVDLQFRDRAVGGVLVLDAHDDQVVATIEPGEGGFIRGVLRAMARSRRSRDLGPESPFRLTRWSNGRLSLEDLATGKRVFVEAFGPTQVASFTALLDSAEQAQ